jgi:menaquinone-specific isochorismate synthase
VEGGHGIDGQREPERLAVHTIPVPDPGDLVDRLPVPAGVAWVRQGEGMVGWGETARITLPAGEDRFTAGEKWLRALFDGAQIDDQVGELGCGLVAFGSFTFDPASDGSVLVVPATILGRRGGRSWLTTISPLGGPEGPPPPPGTPATAQPPATAGPPATPTPSATAGPPATSKPSATAGPWASATAPATSASPGPGPAGSGPPGPPLPRPPEAAAPTEVRWHDGGLSAPDWERAVAAAVARIQAGQLRKVVLARDLVATAPVDIDIRLILRRLSGRYPDCFTFACADLVGATPELLIRRQGREVSSLVLAGTVSRGRDEAEDAALGAALLASAKDVEEHGYAVADVRAALSAVCERLAVDDRPSLLRLANVQHLATWVTGRLARGQGDSEPSALALAAALHPTGAVGGNPAEAAVEMIRDLEGMDRGRYTGPVGWVDSHGNGEWGIALRCAEVDGKRARLFAGCGIVAGSDPAQELAEAQAKFAPMQYALEA